MSQLKKLKEAFSLQDVANLLGFKPKSLSYILYIKPPATKYRTFEIKKRSGGTRLISAPDKDLMVLQKRLSDLLQDCIAEINESKKIHTTLSHGFRRKYSIITNASTHRNKRYVLNIDLENFFGSINFGRVRGFFISNKNFALHPDVATVLAQIACHDNSLPQGSPCSPVISNLIGHLLDIRLAKLAHKAGCTYSRYADDLTFSTNKKSFPVELAVRKGDSEHSWEVGIELYSIIKKAGFVVNQTKTRMQYRQSRQEVTGLIVNSKVNTRQEYRRLARAMVHRLLNKGEFGLKTVVHDAEGNASIVENKGTFEQLNGFLSFIDSVTLFNRKKMLSPADQAKQVLVSGALDSNEKIYQKFLMFKNFIGSDKPVIICEGETDNIYIKAAIRRLVDDYPELATKNADGKILERVKLFRRTHTTARLMGLSGGSGELINFIKTYIALSRVTKAPIKHAPVIILIDNDEGAKAVYGIVGNLTKKNDLAKMPFTEVAKNLYLIPTPLTSDGKDTMIEDFFDKSLRGEKLNGKTFHPDDKGFDHEKHYGKKLFAKYVVLDNIDKINFDGFKEILDRIKSVLDEHGKAVAANL